MKVDANKELKIEAIFTLAVVILLLLSAAYFSPKKETKVLPKPILIPTVFPVEKEALHIGHDIRLEVPDIMLTDTYEIRENGIKVATMIYKQKDSYNLNDIDAGVEKRNVQVVMVPINGDLIKMKVMILDKKEKRTMEYLQMGRFSDFAVLQDYTSIKTEEENHVNA